MIRQKLLIWWADYYLHHLVRVLVKGAAGIVVLGGVVTTPVVAVVVHHKSAPRPPVVVSHAAPLKTASHVVHKALPPPPTTVATPTPVVAPVTQPAAPIVAAPRPIAATAPAPGSGAKQLVPAPAAPASSGSTSTPPSSPSTGTSTAPAPATGGYSSTNWSGYVSLNGTFTAVSGEWMVPSVTGNGATTTADSSWIGIGGASSNDLIQTGTEDTVSAGGQASSSAFYELLPDTALLIPSLTVSAGDHMSATISETSPGNWLIKISDLTTGESYSTTVTYSSTHSSAEWIEEDPMYASGTQVPFDNFGSVSFSGSAATVNGAPASIASSGGQPITLVTAGGQPVATPSVLTGGGNGFTVTHN